MKRFLLSWIILTVLCMGSFLIQTPVSFAQKMTKEAPLGVAGGTLNGIIWESSDQLAFSVSDITSGSGSLEVDIGGGVTRSDVVGLSHFLADSSGFATGDVSVSGGYCTGLSVRVYDGGAGTSFTIPIPSCPSQNSDPITQKYIALGGPSSFLGYPATRENHTPTTTGLYQHFLGTGNAGGGSIYWSPSTGAQSVHGFIRNYWASRGWELSCFGYPSHDEQPWGSGRLSWFQNGNWIYWSKSSGIKSSC